MLITVAGGMFSGKSTELQRQARRLELAKKKVMYFKPDFDNRYSSDEIVTHDGRKVKCSNIPVNRPDVLLGTDFTDVDALAIDEIQFFDNDIVPVVRRLLEYNLTIIVAGLDMDYQSNPFYNTAMLMATADEVVKLQAVCSKCGRDSWVTARISEDKERHVLGSEDVYTPRCRKCYYKETVWGELV